MKALIRRVKPDENVTDYVRDFNSLDELLKFMRRKKYPLMLSFPTVRTYEVWSDELRGQQIDVAVTIMDGYL